MKLRLLLFCLSQSFSILIYAQGGTLDNSFSGNGKQVTAFPSVAGANAVAVQPDSSIVLTGKYISGTNQYGYLYSFGIIRYLKDGSLDPNFGTGGRVYLPVSAPFGNLSSVIIQPDKKILAAGFTTVEGEASPYLYLVRLTKNGALDPDFNHGSPVQVQDFTGVQVVLQSDGRIVVGANWYGPTGTVTNDSWFAALRFNPDGTPDNTFGSGGQAMTKIGTASYKGFATCAALAAGNQVLVTGPYNRTHIITVRFNIDGSLDGNFGPGGKSDVTVNNTDPCSASSMTLQTDGKILIGGTFTGTTGLTQFLALRLTSNGPLDNTFAGNGKKAINFNGNDGAYGIAVNADGTILLGGTTTPSGQASQFALCELGTDGSMDLLFGPNNDGKAVAGWTNYNGTGTCIAVGSDRKIVMGGSYKTGNPQSQFAAMRFLPRFKLPPIILGATAQTLDNAAANLSTATLRLYPNPATDQVQLTGLSTDKSLMISIIDASGKVLLIQRSQGQDHITLDISRLAPGSYRVLLNGAEGSHSIQFVKLI